MEDHCGHGKTWAEECLECDLIGALTTVASFEPRVRKANKRIAELEKKLSAEAVRNARMACGKQGMNK